MGSIATEMNITKIGVIGTGVMGSMLSLLLAEHAGVDVFIHDRSEKSMQATIVKARTAGLDKRVHACRNYDTLCRSLGTPKVFLFSLPHGHPGDAVVKQLEPYLAAGDIVIDGSNENFLVTERRQALLRPVGASYVGMGVSGGFQGARQGPSLMPSGDDWALDALMPLLSKIAAKDEQGRACVTHVGPGGSGHYVKMVHNGIEHGVMSALCETWGLMDQCLKMSGDEIGDVFDQWNSEGPLRNNFLVAISGPICRTRSDSGNRYLLHDISDDVVQDANDSEGTGVWSNLNSIAEHVPAPTLNSAHNFRIASAKVSQRKAMAQSLGTTQPAELDLSTEQRTDFLRDLQQAVYASVLLCFVQGLDLLLVKSGREGWNINMTEILRIWRAGCIIKSDYVTDLFERHYTAYPTQHPLLGSEICSELRGSQSALKRVVIRGLEADAHLPALCSSLDYIKYMSSSSLPTNFMEAQLDAFGAHGFELKGEHNQDLSKGKKHSNWSQ